MIYKASNGTNSPCYTLLKRQNFGRVQRDNPNILNGYHILSDIISMFFHFFWRHGPINIRHVDYQWIQAGHCWSTLFTVSCREVCKITREIVRILPNMDRHYVLTESFSLSSASHVVFQWIQAGHYWSTLFTVSCREVCKITGEILGDDH